jgi:hypothetical protein
MAISRSEALAAIHSSVETINAERPPTEQIPVSDDTALLGRGSQLDSMAFVAFVADLEERLRRATGQELVLVSELISSDAHKPFRSISALADHIIVMAQRGQDR